MVWQGQTSLLIKTGSPDILSQKNTVIFNIKILAKEQKYFIIMSGLVSGAK